MSATEIRCTCCGTLIADVPWLWDADAGQLSTRAGASYRLRRQEVRLLDVLIRRRGEVISCGEALAAMFGAAPPASAEMRLRVVIHSLRKALEPTQVGIISVSGRGYRIQLPSNSELAP